ncbi:MAG: transposase [Deltaproteobacteria bacterium]|nr:transposase [Deltaproteobacteria bacterium]MBW2421099.1 transposase [Deltaproteobacteria bacterium]
MIRGIERRQIFHDLQDYEGFLRRLDRLVPELHFRCFAWVLMPNHVHFALQTGDVPLRKLMARLGTGYASSFNRRHGRVGHLVQNRYKSRLVEGDDDLLNLITYIHSNPLRAGLVPNADALRAFPWSGHGALTGDRPARPFEACATTLLLVGEQDREARQRLHARIREVAKTAEVADERCEAPPWAQPRPRDTGLDSSPLARLIEAVCAERGLAFADLGSRRRSKRVREARGEIAQRAARDLDLPGRAVARALGVSESTVSRALQHRADSPRSDRKSSIERHGHSAAVSPQDRPITTGRDR